jgi:hypothetical protein
MHTALDAWQEESGGVGVDAKAVGAWAAGCIPGGYQLTKPYRLLFCGTVGAHGQVKHGMQTEIANGRHRGCPIESGESGRAEDAGAGSLGSTRVLEIEHRGNATCIGALWAPV